MSDVPRTGRSALDHAAGLLRDLRGMAGLLRLLRHLGFRQPPRRLERAELPPGGRSAALSIRGSMAGFAVVLRAEPDRPHLREVARALRGRDAVRHHVIVVAGTASARLGIACDAPGLPLRHTLVDLAAVHPADLDTIAEMTPVPGEPPTATALRVRRALDRERVGARFFRDVAGVRNLVARSWSGVPPHAAADRDALALLLLSRLIFLCFLQQRGLLAGDEDYLSRLLGAWRRGRHRGTFFRRRLQALFFGVLNRRPGDRTPAARALGDLPYLNGGLFERHATEVGIPSLDLDDDVVASVFDGLLGKYRFTSTEPGADDPGLGIDPEMLGRIFEGLMADDRRGRTGTFYTPSALVQRVVRDAIAHHLAERCQVTGAAVGRVGADAGAIPEDLRARAAATLAGLRILDPACGSGAFLLGALAEVARLRTMLGDQAAEQDVRRAIVADTLHGVDLLSDAALICCLRLWLALVPRDSTAAGVPPLPNLDRRIRQGDALVDPFDVGDSIAGRALDLSAPPELRAITTALEPLARQYLAAEPAARPALRRELARLERRLAGAWLDALEGRLEWEARELTARSLDRDLFGEPPAHAAAAVRRLHGVTASQADMRSFRSELRGRGQLPFFSFRVHFAEAADGFDVILSNPPWVRAHRWPPGVRTLLRERYRVCRDAGWPWAARLTRLPTAAGAQVDLSLLFLERATRLLREGGTLAMLLPAKLIRSLYAGGARDLVLERLRLARIEDHSLDHRGLFDADAYTAVLLGSRAPGADPGGGGQATGAPAPAERPVAVTLSRAGSRPLQFEVRARDLPLRAGDRRSPWLLAPPGCAAALRKMAAAGFPLGEQLRIRRGVMTGGNAAIVVRRVEPRIGDLASIRAEGFRQAAGTAARRRFSGLVEASAIRPALRGTDVLAWRVRCERHLLWAPINGGGGPAPRLQRFLERHRSLLRQEPAELGRLQRLSPETLGDKVVWADLARDLRAAAVPARVRCVTGTEQPVVPLNTVYFIATESHDDSLLLAAYLNSLPLRVFARTIAERAKDAHFRFFAWVVALLPVPQAWREGAPARRLLALSAAAHGSGCIAEAARHELDAIVAARFGLDAQDVAQLKAFDAWLGGTELQTAAAA